MQTVVDRLGTQDFVLFNHMFSNIKEGDFYSDVTDKEVDELLCLYPQNERIIKNFRYSRGILTAELIDKDISYSIAKPDYYTAEQLIMAISQMGYLLSGLVIKNDEYINVDSSFYQPFLGKIKDLECFYTQLNIKFKKKILKKRINFIEMIINKMNYYPTKQRIYFDFIIRVGNSFYAEAQLITT